MPSLPSANHVLPLPALSGSFTRPLWSVMIPTYNCASHLAKTLESVLAQAPSPDLMQIEVVDDHSPLDDPESVVRAIAGNRVAFYRQVKNVGHVRNFNTCLQRAQGHLIHLLHGDDGVRPRFYETMQRPFLEHADIGAAFCRYISVDTKDNWISISALEQSESGLIPKWLERIAEGQRLQPPCLVVRRTVYEHLGGFDTRFSWYGEDWEMCVRIAANYPVWHEVSPLALYRVHSSSLTSHSTRTGKNAQEYRQAIEINRTHLRERLSPNFVNELSRQAQQNFALACLRRAHRMLDNGVMEGPFAQVREALKTSRSPLVTAKAIFGLARLMKHTLLPTLTDSSQLN